MTRLIIWGAGELGARVAQQWRGDSVVGVTKTTQRHAFLRSLEVEPRLGSTAAMLMPEDQLLIALPGDALKAEAVASLAALPPPQRAVLVSTTGYYGTAQGIVDENTPAGSSARARRIARLEEDFLSWTGEQGTVVRLGGLYGPGRGPMAALARRGTASKKPPNRTLPLIHYEDAAQAVSAALQRSSLERIYLAVTPPCPTRLEFYSAACTRLNLPLPEFDDPLPHEPASYDVTRLRRDLLPVASYPDWRAALDVV